MKKKPTCVVFIVPELVPYLQTHGILEVKQKKDHNYIVCSSIDQSGPLLLLTIQANHLWNPSDHDVLIYIPYHSVVYVASLPHSSLNKIPGFHNDSQDVDTPQVAPADS